MSSTAKNTPAVLSAPRTTTLCDRGLWLKDVLGVDGAVGFTVLARALNVLGSTGTVLLIVRFLSPVEQGYYYTLCSLVALQTIFELGFSFVVLQLAAHESARLNVPVDAWAHGDSAAQSRLASVLRLIVRWYSRAGIAMLLILLPIGFVFFPDHQRASQVIWRAPWVIAVFACVAVFIMNPFVSFLEGCGQVREVAQMRFMQTVVSVALAWGAMITHHGLYSPAFVIIGHFSVGTAFLLSRRNLLLGLSRHPVHDNAVCWRVEVWPFQWKIAVSWVCSYFTLQIFIPVLFAFRGPVEAGRMGMSIGITAYLSNIMLGWMSTKAAPFGQMVQKKEFRQLDTLFFRTLRQSMALILLAGVVCMSGVVCLRYIAPGIAARIVPPPVFMLLLLTAISSFVVQSLAIYLRSFKREPYLFQSVAVAVASIVCVLLTVKRWGSIGVAISYSFCTGAVGLLVALMVFQSWRKSSASGINCAG